MDIIHFVTKASIIPRRTDLILFSMEETTRLHCNGELNEPKRLAVGNIIKLINVLFRIVTKTRPL
jgi:hypothetical protein